MASIAFIISFSTTWWRWTPIAQHERAIGKLQAAAILSPVTAVARGVAPAWFASVKIIQTARIAVGDVTWLAPRQCSHAACVVAS